MVVLAITSTKAFEDYFDTKRTSAASCSTDGLKPSTINIWGHCRRATKHLNLKDTYG